VQEVDDRITAAVVVARREDDAEVERRSKRARPKRALARLTGAAPTAKRTSRCHYRDERNGGEQDGDRTEQTPNSDAVVTPDSTNSSCGKHG
jgi:hypothetical protein